MNDQVEYGELMGLEVTQDEDLEEGIKLRAHDLFLRLQGTFSAPNYITLEEVRDATGFDGVRTADAMAISLYRSRGKALWGFEFKVSRNDWLKELKQPEKSESILRYCHHWALVVPDKSIVKDGELPSTWGMYVAQKNRLKCVVPPPKLDPLPLSMTMFTAIAYAINQRQSKADAVALNAARDEGFKSGKESAVLNSGRYEEYYNNLKKKVEEYEKESGLQIQYGWNHPDKVGAAVKMLLESKSDLKRAVDQLKYCSGRLEAAKESMDEQIKLVTNLMEKKAGDDE